MKYLREPLYFEVALESTDPKLELILENCWATSNEDRTSTPSWDIIVDGLVSTQELKKSWVLKSGSNFSSSSCENRDDSYMSVLHPVESDARVVLPSHYKRFSMKMFTFIRDGNVLKDVVRGTTLSCKTTQPVHVLCIKLLCPDLCPLWCSDLWRY